MERIDPWPELDHDPLVLLIDNCQLILRVVLDLCRHPDEYVRLRQLYRYLSGSFSAVMVYHDKQDPAHVAGLFRTLHRLPLPDEVRYFEQLAHDYHKRGQEEPRRAD